MNHNIARSALKAQIGLLAAVGALAAWTFLKRHQSFTGLSTSTYWPLLTLLALACAVIHHLLWRSVDRVDDCGSHFVVKRHTRSQTIRIEEIAWVGFKAQNPPLVTLKLFHASQFGTEISFIPAGDYWRILIEHKSLVAEDINRRIVAAKIDSPEC